MTDPCFGLLLGFISLSPCFLFEWRVAAFTPEATLTQTQAPDEEAAGFKTLNSLLFHNHLRGVAEPETLHASWNDAKRAIKAAGLLGASLKGTLIANLAHGYYLGGRNQLQKEEILDALANKIHVSDIIDEVAFDRNYQGLSWTEEDLRNEISDWDTTRRTLDRGSLAGTLVH